jgi:hypothetical protein
MGALGHHIQSAVLFNRVTVVMAGKMVPNPRRKALEKVLGQVKSESSGLQRALSGPAKLMGGRDVWVGPAASTFENDLAGNSKQVQQSLQSVISSIEAEIARMPAMVSEEDAKGRWAAP